MRIGSYFSIPTDLALAMHDWPEFVSGQEYTVELHDIATDEQVSVRFVAVADSFDYVLISANKEERLYEKVVGRVIIEMLPHTDNLMIYRDYTVEDTPQ